MSDTLKVCAPPGTPDRGKGDLPSRGGAGYHGSVMPCALSVVIPCYNEELNLDPLLTRLIPAVTEAVGEDFEVIFVDDGSRDTTLDILEDRRKSDSRIRILEFSRNFGHQAALTAGMDAASGDAIVLLDADLQDPPELIRELVNRWREGFDVVFAVRKKRHEPLWKRSAYALFYRSLRAVSEIEMPLDAGDFCLMSRRTADAIRALPERNRFLRGLRSWVGFRQTEVEYEREARHAGEPKYTLRKLVGLALTGYVGFSTTPLRISAWLGFLAALSGYLVMIWVLATKIFDIPSPRGWASTLAVILFIGGIQLLVLGVMGEYLGRIYDEVRRRPSYIIKSRRGPI